jgi:hypothetical protein
VEKFKEIIGAVFGWGIIGVIAMIYIVPFFVEKPQDTCVIEPASHGTYEVSDYGREVGDDYVTEGKDGERRICRNTNGEVTSDEILVNPVDRVIHIGVKEPEPVFEAVEVPQYQGGAICNDGWRSYSTGRGTCSWHGGVAYYL